MPKVYTDFKHKDEEYRKGDGESLYTDKHIDKHLKVVKSGGDNTPLEISKDELRVAGNVDISGDVEITGAMKSGSIASPVDISEINTSGEFKIKAGGDVTIDTSDSLKFDVGAYGPLIEIDALTGEFKMYPSSDLDDYFRIYVGVNGYTKFSTTDDAGTNFAYLNINPSGDLWLKPVTASTYIMQGARLGFDAGSDGDDTYIKSTSADILDFYVGGVNLLKLTEAGGGTSDKVSIPAGTGLYFDAGGDTYIYQQAADALRIIVGGDVIMHITESGADGNSVLFSDASVGFSRLEATFSATGVIDSVGTDDTDIDFRHSNKYRLELTNDITNMNLIFPNTSGNFTLVCAIIGSGGGDHDVTNWKVYKANESAASTTDVMWAGGSVPAFTTGAAVDIVSFYWDANEQQAYGVASLAFAEPS